MRPGFFSRLHPTTLLLWSTPIAWLGCAGGGTDIVLPPVSVSTSTTGAELDTDGYDLILDGGQSQPIGPDATLTLDRLAEGEHTLELTGLASNCSVQGENPRSVDVRPGATITIDFAITCSATTGTIEVTTTTSGTGTDPDGYALVLDGADRGAIGVSATSNLSGLSAGSHQLGLTGLAVNCQVAGENPRSVSVTVAQTAQVSFAVTCSAPAPNTGTLEVTTTTTGSDQDPDGYTVSLDGGPGQPIGTNALLSLANVSASEHRVRLQGVATNCIVGGANPSRTTVPSGATATVTFTISCNPRPPGGGTLEITTSTSGSDQDADGYTVTIDGGSGQPIGTNATVTLTDVSAAAHTVQLLGLAENCTVGGTNPAQVTVPSGGRISVAFAVTCEPVPPGTGSIRIRVSTSGTPASGGGYTVTVDNGSAQSVPINGNRTVGDLAPGTHSVQLGGLASNCTVADNPRTVTVTTAQTTNADFTVTCAAPQPTINLRIERMWIAQSTQSQAGDIPLVQGRDAFVRIFVTANSANSAKPNVRVQFFRNGSLIDTRTISAPGSSTPTAVQEGTLNSSWNLSVPVSLVRPGLSIAAEVDAGKAIAETDENDNRAPASGTRPISVREVPTAKIRFISIQQPGSEPGNVSDQNKGQLLELARRMHPINGIDADVDPMVFPASDPLEPDGSGWNQLLSDLDGKRVSEGTDRIYFGVVKLGYGRLDGIVGLTLGQGVPTAAGWDDASDASRVVAHELGHVWNQLHTPCGNPPNIDQGYPYGSGVGVFGLDVTAGTLKPPSSPDVMGYCTNPWISDYTYQHIFDFRAAQTAVAGRTLAQRQFAVLIWGHIVNGQPVLEPAFQIVTRPRLPSTPGPYSVEATASDGTPVFRLSFDATLAADDPQQSRHFTFAVPLDQARAADLAALRLSAPGGQVAATARVPYQQPRAVEAGSIVARRNGQAVTLEWDAAVHPMIMVRDPDTGQVLAFARGGKAQVWTTKGQLDLDVSDGVKSQRVRLAINRS